MSFSVSKKVTWVVGALASGLVAVAQADVVEPFFTTKDLRAIEQPMPAYPRRAEQSGLEGYALVEFSVMADGSVAEPAIARSNSRLFSRAALDAIEEWKFEPVVANGESVSVRSAMRFNFVARD